MEVTKRKAAARLWKSPSPRGELPEGRPRKGHTEPRPMKRARHSEEQIIAVLQEAQAGSTIEELCRRHGISAATYYLSLIHI